APVVKKEQLLLHTFSDTTWICRSSYKQISRTPMILFSSFDRLCIYIVVPFCLLFGNVGKWV
ncbi:hypothetical protein, partial [Porphyromonas circumdentaria]|uniref:hypothetical protein n=1 Tax=Porphyromonas circumdentaria TaxID=29524 RepID=UPI0026DD89EE